ncbi:MULTISPECIES: ABC transporter permease [unclassified Clostridium]|uniref:ABC transporter permease n=1 Tax=Clostridium TaxID=1485 RepID=UPI001C8BE6F0|nr:MULTISPECIES: ABC transporter permease [unclassified Clostridium]MBX9138978.1 ABC transporter permease [Clostridium sp. K12(2020)]MBX9145788.1 ABC transporter permease [Clostridium sp. K13]MDU2289699.1 FtsX-like permease family protein [Clostridium celatum]MDU4325144.1 FtsX-like permease family protein [Clostridium celatum]
MYSKIAISNVKKSFKDYTIYFLTIAFAVCIFYSFNSIESQKALLDMNKNQAEYMTIITTLISVVSVFVSFILGGLILYANNFLIKKRKKELGIYMTLGMRKGKISTILLMETLIVGILSLIAGLLLGLVVSQGLSLFTAKLFDVEMAQFKFVISGSAILKTILYFALIFGVLMIFNTRIIAKYKLIDMLTAARKSENIKIKSPVVSSIIFVVAMIILGTAYYLVSESGLNPEKLGFKLSIVFGIIGTAGFFYGIAGFLLAIIQRSKNIYLKKLNIFVTRQISSKVNTNFVSMTVISLMLFITIVLLSTGLSFKSALEKGIIAPFDASVKLFTDEDSKYKSMEEVFKAINYDFKEEDPTFITSYTIDGIDPNTMLKDYSVGDFKKSLDDGKYRWEHIDALKISDYNKIRSLYGEKPLTISDSEILVTSNFTAAKNSVKNFIEKSPQVNINGKEYKVANKEYLSEAIYNSEIADNVLTIIVPDDFKDMTLDSAYMNMNYKNPNNPAEEEEIKSLFDSLSGYKSEGPLGGSYTKGADDEIHNLPMIRATKTQVYEQSKGFTTMILYIGLYLGIVFLISSAAVLALQQLSEASDSSDRYKSLKKIGATEKMINKTIFTQTVIYFVMPLTLAIVSSIVGINVVNKFIALYGKPNIGPTALLTLGILVIVYGGYFYVTYVGYKSIVKNSK